MTTAERLAERWDSRRGMEHNRLLCDGCDYGEPEPDEDGLMRIRFDDGSGFIYAEYGEGDVCVYVCSDLKAESEAGRQAVREYIL